MFEQISHKIIKSLPYLKSFLFVDSISFISDDEIIGHYKFSKNNFFYDSHFKHIPITPGVILIEMMGQIGLVCHLVYLEKLYLENITYHPILTSVEAEFHKEVKVEDQLTVKAKKIYYRKGILKSYAELYDSSNTLCAWLKAQLKIIIDSKNE